MATIVSIGGTINTASYNQLQEALAVAEYIVVIVKTFYRAWSSRPPPRIESTLMTRTLLHVEARGISRTAEVWTLYGRES